MTSSFFSLAKQGRRVRILAAAAICTLASPLILAASWHSQPDNFPHTANDTYPGNILALEEHSLNYVSGQIIVKFTENAARKIKDKKAKKTSGRSASSADDIVVKLKQKYALKNERPFRQQHTARPLPPSPSGTLSLIDRLYIFETEVQDIPGLAKKLSHDLDVEYAQPDYMVNTHFVPNDPFFSSSGSWNPGLDDLWGLHAIEVADAWDSVTGEAVVIAVLDTGVSFQSTDLAPNQHFSQDIPGNGIDDDNNGFIDDNSGWNFVENNNTPMDDNGHGTHVAGSLGAVFNNGLGIAGVAPDVRIMPLRALDTSGSGSTSSLAQAFIYAVDNGADIINNSWGGIGRDRVFADMVVYAVENNVLPVFSAGNYSLNTLFATPAGEEGALTVAASDVYRNRASFSNFGYEVDIAAPGVEILSLNVPGSTIANARPGNIVQQDYLHLDGTSMSAPHISGLAALMLEQDPSLSVAQIRSVLRETANSWAPDQVVFSGPGIANASSAIAYLQAGNQGADTQAFIQLPVTMSLVGSSTLELVGNASGPGFDHYEVAVAPEPAVPSAPPNFTTVYSATSAVENDLLASIDTSIYSPGNYTLQLDVFDQNGVANSHRIDFTVDPFMDQNWPKYHERLYNMRTGGVFDAVTADLNNDGMLEVVVLAEDKLYVYSGLGELLPGFPVTVPSRPAAGPTLADIDGDGDLEIIFPTIKMDDSRLIYAYEHSGAPVNGFPAGGTGASGSFEIGTGREVVAADIDGNGAMDLITMTTVIAQDPTQTRVELVAVDGAGQALPGFPIFLGSEIQFQSNILAADINRDGKSEIVSSLPNANSSVSVSVYSETGLQLSTMVLAAPYFVLDSVAYRDSVSNDILYGSTGFDNGVRTLTLHRIDSETFAFNEQWSINTYQNEYVEDLLVHDVNGDGHFNLVTQLRGNTAFSGDIVAYNLDGSLVNGFPLTLFPATQRAGQDPIVVGSLANGIGDVFIGTNVYTELSIVDMQGNVIAPAPITVPAFQNSSQTVADIDNDGILEIVANNYGGNLYVWEIGEAGDMQHLWSVARANHHRTNFLERPALSTYSSMNLRTSANAWANQPMTLVADFTWQSTLWLESAPAAFKFDAFGDWSVNFGDNNADGVAGSNQANIALNQGPGEYVIQFNDRTLTYSIEKTRRFEQVYFRGTANSWAAEAMTFKGNSTWQLTVSFDGAPNDRFKFDITGDWSINFGDNNSDGIAERNGADISIFQGAGEYVITFNDTTLNYEVERLGSVDVTFICNNGFTSTGTSVFVVGSAPELGNWSILSNAQKLLPSAYPQWSGSIAAASNQQLQWKCVKGNESNLTITEWQAGSNNLVQIDETDISAVASF